MTVLAHIDALHDKHTFLEAKIEEERTRPMPDFATLSRLKKQKLKIKEEMASLASAVPKRQQA